MTLTSEANRIKEGEMNTRPVGMCGNKRFVGTLDKAWVEYIMILWEQTNGNRKDNQNDNQKTEPH